MLRKSPVPKLDQPTLDKELLVEPVTPADIGHYAAWLEGHLENGGTPSSYRLVEHAVSFFGLKGWIAETGFVISDVSEPDLHQTQFDRIIIADGVQDTPKARTQYYFDNYAISGHKDIPVFASDEFREFAPLFTTDFQASLTRQLIYDANPEHQGVFGGYWPDKRQKTLDEYDQMSHFFGIEISEETIQGAIAIAVKKRREQEQIMATSEYQQRQLESIKALNDMIISNEHMS